MPNAFATISFTESVKAAQRRYGSRKKNREFERQSNPHKELGDLEIEHIQSRDSFYMATISENHWPYVQHRGGPVGFVRVLNTHTIGFADFGGNRQYISVGNLNANARVSIIMMDYPKRRRLKIWGTTRIIHETDEPELIARLTVSGYHAQVERGMLIQIEAIEWNCPQHITPRYSEAEVDHALQALLEENQKLREKIMQQVPTKFSEMTKKPLGDGPLTLVITNMRQLTPHIRSYELRHKSDDSIPAITAGSHLSIPVLLPGGIPSIRRYSISSNPAQQDRYEIAVQLEPDGTGGSRFVHEHFQLGTQLNCNSPRNDFALHQDHRPTVLIAGGIGITPIKAMAYELNSQGRAFQLHYIGRDVYNMAYTDRLQRVFGEQLHLHITTQEHVDLAKLMANTQYETVFYICGSPRLTTGIQKTAVNLGIAETRLRFESFSAPLNHNPKKIEVELSRSGKTLIVPHNTSILNAVEAAGIKTLSDCKVGTCGTCAVKVLGGSPLHCDTALTERNRTQDKMMCICVSRANSDKLVLDL